MLINFAIDTLQARYVDVNSDNKGAIGFYKHLGFEILSYSEYDEFNNPFPIIHTERKSF